jgi:argininosuccinate lyase
VLSRGAQGGAAPAALGRMTEELHRSLDELSAAAAARAAGYDRAEQALLATARAVGADQSPTGSTP